MRAVTVIGVDCATQASKVGLARGRWHARSTTVEIAEARTGGPDLLKTLSGWVRQGRPTLIALDSPLGWPVGLAKALRSHRPGQAILEKPDRLFRRSTDDVVFERVGVRPLDVGADRIARTAHASLKLLHDLRSATDQAIPVAWDASDLHDGAAAIEVYPAATLRASDLPHSSYKKRSQTTERGRILDGLKAWIRLRCDERALIENADVLDAVVCILAGADFMAGRANAPTDLDMARKEGWIWVRSADDRISS